MLGLAALALVLTKADPDPRYGYRRHGYGRYYGGYKKYSPYYYGRGYYHNKGYYPYPYHKGYPAGVPKVVDPLPHEIVQLPVAQPAVRVPVEIPAEPQEEIVRFGNAVLNAQQPQILNPALAPQPQFLADPTLTIQNEILPEPALPAVQPTLPVAQPALPAAQPAFPAAQPAFPAVQPDLPAEAAVPQQPFAVIQPLTIGGGEPVPAVPAPVPVSGVFKPQFEFFANDLSETDEEELIAQQLALVQPAVPLQQISEADLPVALPAFPAVPTESNF